jgi:hypothetical protein
MRIRSSLTLGALMLGLAFHPARAQDVDDPPAFNVRDRVLEIAFDPTKFFRSRYVGDVSTVRITYTGDDWGWPVYAIAVAEGCADEENGRQSDCGVRLRARMVRAPAAPERTRPRSRGARLIGQLVERGARSDADIRAGLNDLGVEWIEADLRTCPGALAALGRSAEADWVPEAVANPTPGDEIAALVMHADIVRVEFQQYARISTYRGWIAEGSPAEWAEELAAVLQPCWRPATTPAPWASEAGAS